MRLSLLAISCLFVIACPVWAQGSQANQPVKDTQESVTISRSEFDALMARIDQMERELQELKGHKSGEKPTEQETPEDTAAATAPGEGGKQLALPDISLIVQAKGLASDDKNDPNRQKIQLSEAELGIQGYVYPNVKADAFIAGSHSENSPFQVEEVYLTYLGLTKGLKFYVGEKHVAFGRTNLLHNHSWLYTRQPLVISNFIAPESLAGQGAAISYLIPTHSDLFAQLDLGTWANGTEGEKADLPDVVMGPGANVTDRINTARLWTSYPVTENSEMELGGSYLDGKSNEDPLTLQTDYVHIKGVDLSYRLFGEGCKRLLIQKDQLPEPPAISMSMATHITSTIH